jgi:hypothetical protein
MRAGAESQVRVAGAGQVQAVRVGEHGRVPVGRDDRRQHRGAGRQAHPAQLDLFGRDPGQQHAIVANLEKAGQLLDGAGDRFGVVGAQPGQLVGVVRELHQAQADLAGRGLVPGHENAGGDRDELALSELRVLVPRADKRAHQVVAGVAPPVGDHLGERVQGSLRGRRIGVPVAHERVGPPPDLIVVRGDAEQLADHVDRQRR